MQLDYQSERHCSKTGMSGRGLSKALDYQSERHCSKTIGTNSSLQRRRTS